MNKISAVLRSRLSSGPRAGGGQQQDRDRGLADDAAVARNSPMIGLGVSRKVLRLHPHRQGLGAADTEVTPLR
jgi:hypothetical protein